MQNSRCDCNRGGYNYSKLLINECKIVTQVKGDGMEEEEEEEEEDEKKIDGKK